jgi:hypothetical protein
LPMTFLGRRMNGNMRHNQSCVTVREHRSNTQVAGVLYLDGSSPYLACHKIPTGR